MFDRFQTAEEFLLLGRQFKKTQKLFLLFSKVESINSKKKVSGNRRTKKSTLKIPAL
jgi:hypothetical protein